jgi:ribonuclease Z
VTVLYHEATFVQKDIERAKATFHSTAEQAARIAAKANVHKLLIGHLSARYENTDVHMSEACTVFNNTIVVEDGSTYKIS